VKAEMAKEAKTAAEIRASERAITEKANQEQQQSNKEKEQAIKEKIGAEARNKLQKGEKVSWDEFQLMMDDDSKEDSETQD